ncbi:MAG: hypothetical protein WC838_03670, partial [Candidatus Margulisiibacteriota bacterium]
MKRSLFGILIWAFLSVAVFAVPNQLTYSGRLLQNGALVNSTLTMTFKIWTDPTAGAQIWSSSIINVDVNQGIYSVVLDQVSPNVFSGDNAYLEVTIGAETLSPRTRINSVGYALQAASVTGLSNVFPSSGNVGIGMTAPWNPLHVKSPTVNTQTNLLGQSTLGSLGLESTEISKTIGNGPALEFISPADTNGGNKYAQSRILGSVDNTITSTVAGRMYLQTRAGYDGSTFPWVNNIVLTSAGNVGIGTTSPGAKLSIAAASNEVEGETIRFNRTDDPYRYNSFYNTASAAPSLSKMTFKVHNAVTTTSQVSVMTLNGAGNVGIGTMSPLYKLDVAGAVNVSTNQNSAWASQVLNSGSTNAHGLYVNIGASSTGVPFRVDKGGSSLFQVDNAGNVGIGTASPGTYINSGAYFK